MRLRAAGSGVVLAAGAGVYAVLVGGTGAGFADTPLVLGLVAVVAGAACTRRRVVATGLVLAGWGGSGARRRSRCRAPRAHHPGLHARDRRRAPGGRRRRRAGPAGGVADQRCHCRLDRPTGVVPVLRHHRFRALALVGLATLAWAFWELYWGLRAPAAVEAVHR